jgi:nitrate/nitrite-specific signal transduction histidine kinase
MTEIYKQILLVVIPLMLLIVAITVPYTTTLIRPIVELTQVAEKVREGDFNIRTEVKSKDEIGTLAEVFNQMAVKLSGYYAELKKTVEERTSELEKSNKTLGQKVEELEQMNKLMVGRELKMVELKEEIEKLKGQTPTG